MSPARTALAGWTAGITPTSIDVERHQSKLHEALEATQSCPRQWGSVSRFLAGSTYCLGSYPKLGEVMAQCSFAPLPPSLRQSPVRASAYRSMGGSSGKPDKFWDEPLSARRGFQANSDSFDLALSRLLVHLVRMLRKNWRLKLTSPGGSHWCPGDRFGRMNTLRGLGCCCCFLS